MRLYAPPTLLVIGCNASPRSPSRYRLRLSAPRRQHQPVEHVQLRVVGGVPELCLVPDASGVGVGLRIGSRRPGTCRSARARRPRLRGRRRTVPAGARPGAAAARSSRTQLRSQKLPTNATSSACAMAAGTSRSTARRRASRPAPGKPSSFCSMSSTLAGPARVPAGHPGPRDSAAATSRSRLSRRAVFTERGSRVQRAGGSAAPPPIDPASARSRPVATSTRRLSGWLRCPSIYCS